MVPAVRLASVPFFDGIPTEALARVAETAEERHMGARGMVIRQDEEAWAVWFLLSGAVQVLIRVRAEDLLVGVLREPGQLLGWSAFTPPYRYTASVRCEEPCELMLVPSATFDELFHGDPALAYRVLRRVAGAVSDRFEGARDLLLASPRQGPVGAQER